MYQVLRRIQPGPVLRAGKETRITPASRGRTMPHPAKGWTCSRRLYYLPPSRSRKRGSPMKGSNVEWQRWGEIDPLYGVAATTGRARSGPHPWTDEEFYERGRTH